VYDSVPTTDGAAASLVLGQADFSTVTSGSDERTLGGPQTVVAESGKLIVADTGHNRVLIWNAIPSQSGAPADVVIGWDSFDLTASGCDRNRLSLPHSVFAVNGKLFVADSGNNRVLIWNAIPTDNGASADLVLGQTDLTHCDFNAGAPGPSAVTLSPADVWSDGTRLVVADPGNDRVLIWNTLPTASGAPADVVVGQTSLTGQGSGATQTTLTAPTFVSSNGNQLFVNDQVNSRVLIWNIFPTTNGAAADVVLGQGDFTHHAMNDNDQDAIADADPTARTLAIPLGVALFGNQLVVTDGNNSRFLIFDGQ
jgi:hypothetical protein